MHISKFFKDKNDKVVIGQWPNIAILAYFGSVILSKVFLEGKTHDLFSTLAFATLFTWAWLEIFEGNSYFRRVLGLVIGSFVVYHFIQR